MVLQSAALATISAAFVFGALLVLLPSARQQLAQRFAGQEIRADNLVSVFLGALIPSMILAGICTDNVGAQALLVLGSMISASAMIGVARAASFAQVALSVAALAAG